MAAFDLSPYSAIGHATAFGARMPNPRFILSTLSKNIELVKNRIYINMKW